MAFLNKSLGRILSSVSKTVDELEKFILEQNGLAANEQEQARVLNQSALARLTETGRAGRVADKLRDLIEA